MHTVLPSSLYGRDREPATALGCGVSETCRVGETSVRLAVAGDVPAITECYLRAWKAAYDADLPHPELVEEAEKRRSFDWHRGIQSESAVVFVVSEQSRVLGVAQAELALPPPRDLPELTMLYVDPDAWGTGTATALLGAAVDWVSQSGGPSVRLRVVEAHARARRFYEREGWVLDRGLAPAANDFFDLVYYRRDLVGRDPQGPP